MEEFTYGKEKAKREKAEKKNLVSNIWNFTNHCEYVYNL